MDWPPDLSTTRPRNLFAAISARFEGSLSVDGLRLPFPLSPRGPVENDGPLATPQV